MTRARDRRILPERLTLVVPSPVPYWTPAVSSLSTSRAEWKSRRVRVARVEEKRSNSKSTEGCAAVAVAVARVAHDEE